MTIEEWLAKYGTRTFTMLLHKYMREVKGYPVGSKMDTELTAMAAQLEGVFDDYINNTKVRVTRDGTSWTPEGFQDDLEIGTHTDGN